MSFNKIVLPLGLLLSVAACSPGPSNANIEQAFQDNIDKTTNMLSGLIGDAANELGDAVDISVDNTSCDKLDDDRFQCSFTMTMNNPILGGEQTSEQMGVFVKRDGRWRIVVGY
jgi:hypothetical protein